MHWWVTLVVAQFYDNFEQLSDDDVRKIMKRHGHEIGC